MTNIFISYRRDDSQWATRRVNESLKRFLPEENIFMDVDSVAPGVDFLEVVGSEIAKCDVVLAIIGPDWAGGTVQATGKNRLFDASDYVRNELVAALDRDIPVVPVLLEGVTMPPTSEMPDELHDFSRRNAVFLSDRNFDHDIDRLADKLGLKQPSQEKSQQKPKKKQRGLQVIAGVIMAGVLGMLVVPYFSSTSQNSEDFSTTPTINDSATFQDVNNNESGIDDSATWEGVEIFSECNFGGPNLILGKGMWSDTLIQEQLGDNTVLSLKIPKGYDVVMTSKAGVMYTFLGKDGPLSCFSEDWGVDGRVSSISVTLVQDP